MRPPRSSPISIGVVATLMLACNLMSPGPSKTFESFLYAVENGRIEEARTLCSGGLQAMLGPKLGIVLTAQGERMRQQGGIKSIETKEEIVGETATVRATITFKNGQSERTNMKLLKENGVWRISQ